MTDSRDLVSKLSKLKVSSCSEFMKLSIKDYFMSGEHPVLPEITSRFVLEHRMESFEKA